ncbi:MAG: peptidylprolyl isomerase, partial [Actinobacteria bacterium]|nr:peptidylprolyl isomerase [Actinomycetota bacterium]
KGYALEVEGTKVSTRDFGHRIDLLRALYNVRPPADKVQLAVPEKRHLRHLVVATEDGANQALAGIKGGESFQAVAKAVSLDTATKDKGGDLGALAKAQLDPAFGAAAFAVAKGATFGPVQTKSGWHVGQVVDIVAGHAVTLAGVHDSLKDTLLGEARLAEWNNYLAARLRTADAFYAKGNRPANPKSPSAVTPSTLTPTPATTG